MLLNSYDVNKQHTRAKHAEQITLSNKIFSHSNTKLINDYLQRESIVP